MNVRKFIAANARDALRKVKETLGNDAIILSNRGVPGGVEIMAVAARDMAMIVPTPVSAEPPAPVERRPVAPPPRRTSRCRTASSRCSACWRRACRPPTSPAV